MSNDKHIVAHHTTYLTTAFNQQGLMSWLEEHLGPHLDRFDLIVGTGTSGLLVIPLAAYTFGKRFAIVRKGLEGCHSTFKVEGRIADGDRWLFLDDLIASGATRDRVKRAMYETCFETTLAGVCLYHEMTTVWAADYPDHLWFRPYVPEA